MGAGSLDYCGSIDGLPPRTRLASWLFGGLADKPARLRDARGAQPSPSKEVVGVANLQCPRQPEILHEIGGIAVVGEAPGEPRRVLLVEDVEQIEVDAMVAVHIEEETRAEIDDNVVAILAPNAANRIENTADVIERCEQPERPVHRVIIDREFGELFGNAPRLQPGRIV